MLKTILKPFASLTLTVILLALSMVLIYAGTLAQVDMDVWGVQHKYFHSFFTWMPLQDLVPRFTDRPRFIGGSIPFPGGYIIGSLLLVNLLCAHALRFKFSPMDLLLIPQAAVIGAALYYWQINASGWLMFAAMVVGVFFIVTLFLVHNKRAGVIVIHLGLILLLIGEGITSGAAKESRMQIEQGTYANYSVDIRNAELAVVDSSAPDHNMHAVVPARMLKAGQVIDDARLPFQIKVERYFQNSQRAPASKYPDAPSIGAWTVEAAPNVNGVGNGAVDMPSAFVTLSRNGTDLGTHLLTAIPGNEQRIEAGGKTYQVALRFERLYKPYTIFLKKFSFDRYIGPNTPTNYSSDIVLTDPSHGEKRDVRIWMNHPLRYQGETFYQSGFDPNTETATVLQVVRNPGATMPYIAILIALIGLIIHFGLTLVNFLSKRDLSGSELALGLLALMGASILGAGAYVTAGVWGVLVFVAAAILSLVAVFLVRYRSREGSPKAGAAAASRAVPPRSKIAEGKYELAPSKRFGSAQFLVPAGLLLFCAVYVIGHALPQPLSKQYDLDTFARMPVSYEGRVQPFDSLARNALKVLRGRESALLVETKGNEKEETKIQPVAWLLDVMAERDVARKYKIFAIDHPDVKTLLGLDDKERFFSIADISPNFEKFAKLAHEASEQKELNPRGISQYQAALVETGNRFFLYQGLSEYYNLHLFPRSADGKDWYTLVDVAKLRQTTGETDPMGEAFARCLQAYGEQSPIAFNAHLHDYQRLVEAKVGDQSDKTAFEAWFNRFDPFVTAMVFYVFVFVLAALSWVNFAKPLSRAAFWVLVLAMLLHTFGLAARIYMSGRPPVTNLASAAIFVGWGVVVFAVGLELIYRNGVGSVLAACAGFPTLMIALRLSLDGDTMKVLQAVLDTNIWLATHVVSISLGYAATFLAGLLGIVYVVLGVFTTRLDADMKKSLSRMMYGITCFAILFSFVGTILGGIWADQSWGRFWGWDPKENGAILIVLANAIFLHARWGGLVKERGMANIAIFGNIVTVWSFFGTNQLGVGLHAYGSMGATVLNLIMFIGAMIFFIGCGLLPLENWRSFKYAATIEHEGDDNRPPPARPIKTVQRV
jgi:ABC-type transport system involved in cytochrome c biogenesis permease subunit